MARRFMAQRVDTREFIHTNLPIDAVPRHDLSGSGSLSATITPDLGLYKAADGRLTLEEWGTILHEEVDGIIRWSGLVAFSRMDGQSWSLEAGGISCYMYGMPYLGTYSKIRVDPADAVRHMWAHLQSYPNGDLGVTVKGSTKVRIGTEKKDVSFKTGSGAQVDFETGPYELNWWEAPDIGREVDNLAKQTPFDWVERHRWNEDKTDVIHEIEIGYPRLGRYRDDLAFEQNRNIIEVITPDLNGDDYANEVVGIGAGEGKKALRRSTAIRDGRLRRVYVREDKSVSKAARMDALIRDDLTARRQLLQIDKIVIRDHEAAPFGSFQLGDDITVKANLPHLGRKTLKCRIVSWEQLSKDRAALTLARSDSFVYGG